MDILVYVTIALLAGVYNCYKNDNMHFDEVRLDDIQNDIGDESLGEVSRVTVPIKDGTEGYYHEDAFMKIVKELGLA